MEREAHHEGGNKGREVGRQKARRIAYGEAERARVFFFFFFFFLFFSFGKGLQTREGEAAEKEADGDGVVAFSPISQLFFDI